MEPIAARRTWRSLEAVHGMIYFSPDAVAAYAAVGVTNARSGYFMSRAAPMGAVTAEVVTATFFNFHPTLVRESMQGAWDIASPAAMSAARLEAVDTSLRRAFGPDVLESDDVRDVAELLRRAAHAAGDHLAGRPLFAGHVSLDWPTEPHLVLWHAQSLLREFRGDAHVAALLHAGLSGLDALVTHAASGDVPAEVLRASRAWSNEEWDHAVADLTERGILAADGGFTAAGRAMRDEIETASDLASLPAYSVLSDDEAERVRTVGKSLTRLVIGAGLLPIDPKRFLDESQP